MAVKGPFRAQCESTLPHLLSQSTGKPPRGSSNLWLEKAGKVAALVTGCWPVDQRPESHRERKVMTKKASKDGLRALTLGYFRTNIDAEWPRLGQTDRTPMPAMKRSRNAPTPKRGARSGITASATQVQPENPELPEGGWTVSNCPPFMIYNKKHLSKECAAGIVTNGAGVVPGIYLCRAHTKTSRLRAAAW